MRKIGTMPMVGMAVSLALSSQTVAASPALPPCKMKIGLAVGCSNLADYAVSMTNAVKMYQQYGLNRSLLEKGGVSDYVGQFSCNILKENGSFSLTELHSYRVTTPTGDELVHLVQYDSADRHWNFWIADGYFSGGCGPKSSQQE
jgi:hypothetical protein